MKRMRPLPDIHPLLKKLQVKSETMSLLVLQAPTEYETTMKEFDMTVDQERKNETYGFIQVFGISNETIKEAAQQVLPFLQEDGLLWLCYPKKSSKKYKGSNCSRDTVAALLAEEGFEPVRQIAIDEDWSALRFRPVDKIKTMKRSFAVTEKGKARTEEK
ncbi:DUF3052 domain-containing protein [Alkalihalobacillus sp. LMS39]|uniref:DUF3052 domain-containing protein n=1 Tax=Alkalihalobacillus sp. LMS39 TaxID=2924032 RepID=UPI001FB3EF13|nr:DUF3052 domain-containing protein [Alkalihalobacillus sp. LMS39]UOE94924.1 DUF3052 domain-containing protein [Alkalihalobacillus sp. LMS39]